MPGDVLALTVEIACEEQYTQTVPIKVNMHVKQQLCLTCFKINVSDSRCSVTTFVSMPSRRRLNMSAFS